ncbi:cytidylyltransferase domain-containing protein [Halobacillus sp. MO56]
MKVAAIVQARMGSTRLPGKVLKKVLNRPLLAYQLERVKRSLFTDQIVIATTDTAKDDPLVSWCEKNGVTYYRGSETDVLQRYYRAALSVKAETVIRLTADCPLIDPFQIDNVVNKYLSLKDDHPLQYVSNTLKRTFPRGMDTEIFSYKALEAAHNGAKKPNEREHVTKYMIDHPDIFRLTNVNYSRDESNHRWTVDTTEDFLLVKKILEALYPRNPYFTLENILELLEKHPEWQKINAHILQKKSEEENE